MPSFAHEAVAMFNAGVERAWSALPDKEEAQILGDMAYDDFEAWAEEHGGEQISSDPAKIRFADASEIILDRPKGKPKRAFVLQ
jgi:hypothetical protein